MEDAERQKKLEAGKAKLAEYRQRKAHADSQKKEKKKRKKKQAEEDPGGDARGFVEVESGPPMLGEDLPAGGRIGVGDGGREPTTTELTFSRTLRSGETVKHDQTYTIEPDSEVSTTAEDYSSEEEAESLQHMAKGAKMQDMQDTLAAKTQAVEELRQELEDIRATFGTEGVHQLQDFEAALKQRDGIITQLTANLQQAREEKDEIMREFLEMTEQSRKLHVQFQQLQAGETLRNTSHSSTAADLLLARQQIVQHQQQLEEMTTQLREHRDASSEHLLQVAQLQDKLAQRETVGKRSEESFAQELNEKDLMIAEKENLVLGQQQLLADVRAELALSVRAKEESFAQTLREKDILISEQNAIITEHERSLTLLRVELTQVERSTRVDVQTVNEKDVIIAEQERVLSEQERVLSEREHSHTQLEDELASSQKRLNDLYQQMTSKEQQLEKCLGDLESARVDLESAKVDLESYKGELETSRLELEKGTRELEISKGELATSRQKERMSSNEIMQLMGTVEDLQKRCHQGSTSESDKFQRMEEESLRKLECLRAELDELYGQQIVQMKQELNSQHAAELDRIAKQHHAELEALEVREDVRSPVVDRLNAEMNELQEMLRESRTMHNSARQELSQLAQDKLSLQAQVEELLQDLHAAEDKVQKTSRNLAVGEEIKRTELQRLQRAIDDLKRRLDAADEAAREVEAKHESETTNYKIKLEMLEREKDAVLDRMAQSQEAELDRLRTQLLFSHEEELVHLRGELQRESFLNAENLLNEASGKHERALEGLRTTYEEKLRSLGKEKAGFVAERDELLEQMLALKDDLKLALNSSKADELVLQLQALQAEVEELRRAGDDRARMEGEFRTLLIKLEALEKQTEEKEEGWKNKMEAQESEKRMLIESNGFLKGDLESLTKTVELLSSETNLKAQEVTELREEMEKQQTTFSFAERNFEVNYQELKEEYSCLIQANKQLEERTLKETLEFEAKIAGLQRRVREMEESGRRVKMEDGDRVTLGEKHTTELMEKLSDISNEKECLIARLSDVTKQLSFTEGKLEKLKGELLDIHQQHGKVVAHNKSLATELDREREVILQLRSEGGAQGHSRRRHGKPTVEREASLGSVEDRRPCVESSKGEVEARLPLSRAAEAERGGVRGDSSELQRPSQTPSSAAAQSSGEGQQKPTASGSSRRKRRQRSKQEHKSSAALPGSSKEKSQREEEEEEAEEEPSSVAEAEAGRAAEPTVEAQMESRVASRSNQRRGGEEDFTDRYQGDGDGEHINKRVASVEGLEPAEERTTEHGECRLQLEAQHLSLSQIHAAQLELLGERADAHSRTLETQVANLQERCRRDEPGVLQHQSIIQAVSEECKQLIVSLADIFGEELLDVTTQQHPESSPAPLGGEEECGDSGTLLLKAKVVYRDLLQVKENIEQELDRLSQLQAVLRADGNKMMALQKTHEDLKRSTEEEICRLRKQAGSLRPQGVDERASHVQELERVKAEAQGQRLQLEERHRLEVEHLRSYYQQQAVDTEARYATELIVLGQRTQELTSAQRPSSGQSQSGSEMLVDRGENLKQQQPGPEGRVEEEEEEEEVGPDAEGRLSSARPLGLRTQLQTLRKALYHKYAQEVAALKEQHSAELRGLREELEGAGGEGEKGGGSVSEQASDVAHGDGPAEEGQALLEEKQYWDRVEEEVAKVIVQMSVEFAHQSELARLCKRARQTTSSMQTHRREEGEEGEEDRERTKAGVRQAFQAAAEEEEEEEKEEEEGMGKTEADRVPSQGGAESCSLEAVTSERNLLREANAKLRQVLVEVLKTTEAAEETMGLHVESLRGASSGGLSATAKPAPGTTPQATWQRLRTEPFQLDTAGSIADSCQGGVMDAEETSVWSGVAETDGGLETSQPTVDSLLYPAGAEALLGNEVHLMAVSSRLQSALERMLVTITETTNQVEHARVTQTELMRESFRHNQEIGELLQRQEELQERLAEEAQAREQLALELHRAEGLIDGYTGERAALEEQVRQKGELQLSLEQELQVTISRLSEREQERLQMYQEKELLTRQQDAMREQAGPRELRLVDAAVVAAPEADLLEETEKLMKEKVEVQRQAEKEHSDLVKQVKVLEAELEEQVNRSIELEHTHRSEGQDLRQQIQALEKQLEKNRRFLDEQAVDREHERDVFQQEILKLEEQLKSPQKLQAASEQRNREVDRLSSQLKEKADWCSELLLGSEQQRRELSERDQEIDKLENRLRQLEQALLASTESLEKVEERKTHASASEARHSALEAQLRTEREALDRKEKEISNLEEQLEQFREELQNKSEEVQQLHMQLEIQRKELSSQQQYLETRESMLQVMEVKDRQIEVLNEKLIKLQHMETSSDQKDQREDLIRDLESQVECMRSEQERLKRNGEEELEQLNAVIDKLQQELANMAQKPATEEEEEEEEEEESDGARAAREEHGEAKRRLDAASGELHALRAQHGKLLRTYRRLKESAAALAETESPEGPEDLEEALRETTAGLVVRQAQLQALEQSAASRVEELRRRVEELEGSLGEKDGELARHRLLVEEARDEAEALRLKVADLEDKLMETLAASLVSRAQVDALQQEGSQDRKAKGESQGRQSDAPGHDFGDFGIPQIDFGRMGQARVGAPGKVARLTERLRELEVRLGGVREDQELQEQLLSSSEEEVLAYEKSLCVLMDLLVQMKATAGANRQTQQSPAEPCPAGEQQSTVPALLQQLQEVRDEATTARAQLDGYRQSCSRLQEQLEEKASAIATLQELQKASSGEESQVTELRKELLEAQREAVVAREELSCCQDSCEKLQGLLLEREMTIAHLKGELFRVTAEDEGSSVTELLRELQGVRAEAATTKEEFDSCRRQVEELREEVNVRDRSIAKLEAEMKELQTTVARSAESTSSSPSPSPQPSSTSASASAQPKRKAGKALSSKGGGAKEKSSLSRKSSAPTGQSSEKPQSPAPEGERRRPLHPPPQRRRVPPVDSSTQTEDLQSPSAAAKDEVEEVIAEFQEKIGQMQELHAAEILDMEARHISESEGLRMDTQALENECKALKAVIDKLRSGEAPSVRIERPASLQYKDGYTSDSSSDYSQRTGYDPPGLQQEFRSTPEGARRETDDQLPDKIKTLLREVHQEGMQVLSLSEFPLAEGEPARQMHAPGWAKERGDLLATVESLKSLITQIQTHGDAQTSGGTDWRMELLCAVQQVFLRERGVLTSALYSQLDLLDTSDAIIHLNLLEHRLAEQDALHREAMGSLHTADRSSLIAEVRQLRGQLEQIHQGLQPALPSVADSSVEAPRGRTGAGSGDPDGLLVEELKGELAQTKLELETTLRAQHKHLKELDALRTEVSRRASEVDALTDHLSEERKKSRELQWEGERERCRTGRSEERKREELEDLHATLEEQQSSVATLMSALEQERQASSQLVLQTHQEQLSLQTRLRELQVQLETEQAKAQEMSCALGRERQLRVGASSSQPEEEEEGAVEGGGGLEDHGAVLQRLQRDLDDKHTQVVQLLGELEAQKLEAVRRQEAVALSRQQSQQEQRALGEARARLATLETQMADCRAHLEREGQRRRGLEEEKEALEEKVAQLGRLASGARSPDGHDMALQHGVSSDHTKDWVLQQKSADAQNVQMGPPHWDSSETGHASGPRPGPWRSTDLTLGKLHVIASKIRTMAGGSADSLTTVVDNEELSWIQSNIDEVITTLQQSPMLPAYPEGSVPLAGGSSSASNSLSERLLRQNAELTGFVSRLTEEKNDLRNQTLRLEEELRHHRRAGLGSGDNTGGRRGATQADPASVLLSQEREAWAQERMRLERSLQLSQAQAARLRGEIRTEALRELRGPEADNTALKRMYGRYLRSESFRKALIYQKKYLLLLLGGFQECEEATLALICRMGGRPAVCGLDAGGQRRRGLTRFRSAVRVSIALSRMRFLVKRWQKATGMSASSPGSLGKNAVGHATGTEAKDSPFLHPGSVEVYRERGGGGGGTCGSRGRSGRESPRSAASATHHRFHLAGSDQGSLTCSHLQNYDPDRALTDYISRLEALQRRLGSVTSGSSSYAPLHFGLRR